MVCLLATITSPQITFERQQYSAADYSSVFAAADLNNDGATDLIVAQLIGLGNNDGFVVYLSNGDRDISAARSVCGTRYRAVTLHRDRRF